MITVPCCISDNPVKVLLLLSTNVPDPCLIKPPVPKIALSKYAICSSGIVSVLCPHENCP